MHKKRWNQLNSHPPACLAALLLIYEQFAREFLANVEAKCPTLAGSIKALNTV